MFVSAGWLLFIYLSPVLSIIPIMLLWHGLAPLTTLLLRLRFQA